MVNRRLKIEALVIALLLAMALSIVPANVTNAQQTQQSTLPDIILVQSGGTPTTTIPTYQACGYYPPELATQLANVPWYCPINQQITAEWNVDLPYVFISLILAFLVSGLIIMIGIAGKSDSVRNFGMGELYEAIASTIIVGLFIYITAALFGLLPANLVGTYNPYATALNLINTTITTSENLYTSLYQTYITDSFFASVNIAISYPLSDVINPWSLIANFFDAAKQEALMIQVIEPIQVITGVLNSAIIVLWSEYYLIVFFSVAAIPVFIVPGVLFRIFLPTRPFGGMLLSLGIGFYLVMPTLFAIVSVFGLSGANASLGNATAQISNLGAGAGAINNSGQIATQLQTVTAAMSQFWLMIIFFPGLIIALTYSFVTQMANFIGGVSYSGSRLRSFI
jgi:hypothetical protein